MTTTQDQQFNLDAVQQEHRLVVALQPKLTQYADREFRELPPQLQEQIRAIRSLNLPTQSGLEHVEPILAQLAKLRYLLEKIIAGESIDEAVKRFAEPIPPPGSILEGLTPGEQIDDGSVTGDERPPVETKAATSGTLTLGGEQAASGKAAIGNTRQVTGQPTPVTGTLKLGGEQATAGSDTRYAAGATPATGGSPKQATAKPPTTGGTLSFGSTSDQPKAKPKSSGTRQATGDTSAGSAGGTLALPSDED